MCVLLGTAEWLVRSQGTGWWVTSQLCCPVSLYGSHSLGPYHLLSIVTMTLSEVGHLCLLLRSEDPSHKPSSSHLGSS